MVTRPGFNPARRSRNIGTAAQGHGNDNRHVIPESLTDRRVWGEKLNPCDIVEHEVCGQRLRFFVEHTRSGFAHSCSVADVCRVLAGLPVADWADIECFVFRQATRRQRLLSATWGRMFYCADLGVGQAATQYTGPLVILDAQDHSEKLRLRRSMSVPDQAELARLIADGHAVESTSRHHVLTPTRESVRATQLYRTLLHEIGHWVDYSRKVEEPHARGEADAKTLDDRYWTRISRECEEFAHRYAAEAAASLRAAGIIPFAPITT